jgi:hypothetical protein
VPFHSLEDHAMGRKGISCALIVLFSMPPLLIWAQNPAAKRNAPPAVAAPATKGRLPANYGKLVDEAQRQRIYQIQSFYAPQIDDLKQQLDALIARRDAEIHAVLTPTQQRQLDMIVANGKGAKAKKEALADDDNLQFADPMPKDAKRKVRVLKVPN